MKLLYIGYYREPTIWGQQCVDTVRALEDIPEFDVVVRALDLRPNGNTPASIISLEYKPVEGSEVCYQQVLDDHYVGSQDVFKHTKHLTDNMNIIHPDVLRQKYEPLNIAGAAGYKFYTITDGSRDERRQLDRVYEDLKGRFNPDSNATFTIFTSNPEAIQKELEEIDDVQKTIKTIVVPIESTEVPLPQIHNWGDEYENLTSYKESGAVSTRNFGYNAQMAEFFGRKSWMGMESKSFSEWEENPVAYDLAWRKTGLSNCLGWWESNKKYLKEGVLDAQD